MCLHHLQDKMSTLQDVFQCKKLIAMKLDEHIHAPTGINSSVFNDPVTSPPAAAKDTRNTLLASLLMRTQSNIISMFDPLSCFILLDVMNIAASWGL